ncbi:MAG: UDP-2,3-diacylglucosamine diphosphatase LpxI [Cypionkella sp.]|nr:UDP-2,3-diacylglucosamine diphosphatase LpxI [Cypionkella sp.]
MSGGAAPKLALIAGAGALPAALVAALPTRPLICALDGFAPEGVEVDITFRLERLALLLRDLEDRGVTQACFAGAVQRPRLDPSLFDPATAQMVPRILAAMGQGDDGALRAVIGIFEEAGFAVQGAGDIAPALIPAAGVYGGEVTPSIEADAARAETIVAALGAVDVGQGCVVAGGQCLAVEVVSGTDAMLASLHSLGDLRPAHARGVFYKSAKPGQDRRIDLPTIGPRTVEMAAKAGLGAIVWRAGDVICLDLPTMSAAAKIAGLTLWAR